MINNWPGKRRSLQSHQTGESQVLTFQITDLLLIFSVWSLKYDDHHLTAGRVYPQKLMPAVTQPILYP